MRATLVFFSKCATLLHPFFALSLLVLPACPYCHSYWVFNDGSTTAAGGANASQAYCQNGNKISGDGSLPSNLATNCSVLNTMFEEPIYGSDGNPARFWLPLSTTRNVALKNDFMGVGGTFFCG